VQVDPAEKPTLEPSRSAAGGGNGNLVYEHESLAGSDAIMAAGAAGGVETAAATAQAPARHEQRVATEWDTVGRNDPCPCGSGKKYKKCHGA
jgi:preprotein translocase subunit SecA